jgi:hypothetical protein
MHPGLGPFDTLDHAGGQIVAGRAYLDTLERAVRLAALAALPAAARVAS